MNDLEIFTSEEFGKIRTIMINDNPYFVGKDIAKALRYSDVNHAILDHVYEDDRVNSKTQGQNNPEFGQRGTWLINESGMYSLIFSSKLPSANKFKHWITSEVIPSIRKHGAYMTEQTIEKVLTSPDFIIQLATQLKNEQEARKLAEKTIEEQKPLVEFAKHVTESSDTVDVGEFAKIVKNEKIDIGRNRLFEWLRANDYLMSNNVPYQKYVNNNFFKVIKTTKETAYGTKVFSKTLITGKGQVMLVEKLRQEFGTVA